MEENIWYHPLPPRTSRVWIKLMSLKNMVLGKEIWLECLVLVSFCQYQQVSTVLIETKQELSFLLSIWLGYKASLIFQDLAILIMNRCQNN